MILIILSNTNKTCFFTDGDISQNKPIVLTSRQITDNEKGNYILHISKISQNLCVMLYNIS